MVNRSAVERYGPNSMAYLPTKPKISGYWNSDWRRRADITMRMPRENLAPV